ncbi:motility associated factor glycosyltransferase family protein [Desulfolutivibrio sp.]|uniref:motility associated factor glycosyltransferase family protein n=1 Tax=Desulfolutivibrio sp. TaxID=2773296 RepID=UPI002F963F73
MPVNVFLQDNLSALTAAKAPVITWLASQNIVPETLPGRLIRNPMGHLDYQTEQGARLHGAIPPSVAYRDWTPADDGRLAAGGTIIIGSGLGYGINHILTKTPDTHKVLVIEPRADLLLACLGQTDYRPFLAAGKLEFLPPDKKVFEERLRPMDVCFIFGKIHLRSDLPSSQFGPEYARWTAHARARLENISVELSTLRQKQDVMVGNELKNYHRAMSEGSLLGLRGMGQGMAAVVLGAGPSLARFAPELAKRRGRALYATALQTLPALEGTGLRPDICMAIDFRPEMRVCIDNLRDKSFAADIPLIYSTKMDPEVLAMYPGPTLPMWSVGGLATYVMADQEMILDAGGNVGVSLFRFLYACGVSSILLAGQDFSWAGEYTHAPGHHSAAYKHRGTSRHEVTTTNAHGQTIHTTVAYMAAKRDLEQTLREGNIRVCNLYGGGLVIESAKNVTLDEAHRCGALSCAPGSLERFFAALQRARSPRVRPVFAPRAAKWSSSLKNAGNHLEKLFKHPGKKTAEIRTMFQRLTVFFKQDPLYLPYLYNEIMDVSGLCHARTSYGMKDMVEFRHIRKRVLDKVREMDRRLSGPGEKRAA